MSSFAIRVADEDAAHGPYMTRDEVRVALEEIRATRGDLRGVSVWEMSEGGTAGAERDLHEFVDPGRD